MLTKATTAKAMATLFSRAPDALSTMDPSAMSAAECVSQFGDESSDNAPGGGPTRFKQGALPLASTKSSSFPYLLENVVASGAVAPDASWGERDVRDAAALADCARSGAEISYTALAARCLSLQQDEAKLQAERGALALARSGPQAGPVVPLPFPHRPGTISGCARRTTSSSDGPDVVEGFKFDHSQRGVTEAAGGGVSPRSMAEITSSLESAADTLNGRGAVERQSYATSPHDRVEDGASERCLV